MQKEVSLVFNEAGCFTRCLLCNEPLAAASFEECRQQVPPRVQEGRKQYYKCPICGKIYWHGTHVANTIERMKRLGFIK